MTPREKAESTAATGRNARMAEFLRAEAAKAAEKSNQAEASRIASLLAATSRPAFAIEEEEWDPITG